MSATPGTNAKINAVPTSQAVVERVAAREGVDHSELVPLFEAIDPEALDRLAGATDGSDSTVQIEFAYHGYTVTVTGDGVVSLDRGATVQR